MSLTKNRNYKIMKKIFTSILMLTLCSFISAQAVLNVDGTVSSTNGDAMEGVFLSMILAETGEAYTTLTDDQGYYSFSVDLTNDGTQGCFEVFLIDCTFEPVNASDCYNPGNTDFTFDFIFCENGSDDCHSFIVTEIIDSSLVLSTLDFGVPTFTYAWSDGSSAETITLPLDATGEYCVTVTDSNDCVSENCIDLTPPDECFVHIFPEFDFTSTILYAEGYGQSDMLDFVWSTGETTQSIVIEESGEYCVTMTDVAGCESIDCGYFEVDTTWNGDCFSYIYVGNQSGTDSTDVLYVESFGTPDFTYVWSFGDSIVSTSDYYEPTESGVYCVTVTDANNCVSTACYDYFIWEECGVWIGCDPIDQGVQLWAFGYGEEEIEYIWNTGDTGPELIVSESGEYCVTITDANGCSSTACITVDVNVSECFAPIEIIEFPDSTILTVNPVTDGQYEFVWTTGETTPSITVTESGVYCVEVVEIETGCTFFTCVDIYIGGFEECWGWIETEYNGDSSAILSVFAVDISNDSLDFIFEWSTGEVAETIEVTEEGEYCVTVTGASGCSFEACTDVIFWDFPWDNAIIGIVLAADTGEPLDASIDLYSVNDDGSIDLYSEGIQTVEQGFFSINEVESGNYIALATAENGDFVPTYGLSTTSWEEADVHEVGDFAAVIPLEIHMIPITNLEGDGTIEGIVSSANLVAKGNESASRNGTPVVGANVMLMHSDVPVGQVFTNDDGQFKFAGLPYGTYEVVLEVPGQPQKIVEVTLSEDNPNDTDVEFETEDSTTSTHNISALSSLTLSPNPTSNTLAVQTYFEEARDVLYRIVDMNGKIVESSTFNAAIGQNTIQIDVTSMTNGVYNLVLQSDKEIVSKRFVKL